RWRSISRSVAASSYRSALDSNGITRCQCRRVRASGTSTERCTSALNHVRSSGLVIERGAQRMRLRREQRGRAAHQWVGMVAQAGADGFGEVRQSKQAVNHTRIERRAWAGLELEAAQQ